jgi:hypothetical protein
MKQGVLVQVTVDSITDINVMRAVNTYCPHEVVVLLKGFPLSQGIKIVLPIYLYVNIYTPRKGVEPLIIPLRKGNAIHLPGAYLHYNFISLVKQYQF